MTVIVGYKDKGKVWMAADSEVTRGWVRGVSTLPSNYKIFRPHSDMPHLVVGHTGSVRDGNIFQYLVSYLPELVDQKNGLTMSYIVAEIVPSLFEALQKSKRLKEVDGKIDDFRGAIMMAYRGSLYVVFGDGAVIEADEYCAIGSGEEHAIGFLNRASSSDVRSRVIDAVKSACVSSVGVGGSVVITNTSLDGYEVVEG